MQEINFVKSSNNKASNFVRQSQFLSGIQKKLEENPQSVIDDLNRLRALITSPEALHVQVIFFFFSLIYFYFHFILYVFLSENTENKWNKNCKNIMDNLNRLRVTNHRLRVQHLSSHCYFFVFHFIILFYFVYILFFLFIWQASAKKLTYYNRL